MSVYFVTCREAEAVKIGNSLEPHARLRELQAYCPLPLKLEAVLPGGTDVEKDFHGRFADERIHGEWFRITDMIEVLIARNPPGPPPAKTKTVRRPPKESGSHREERLHREWIESVRRAGARRINAAVKSGEIHFPFREREEA